MKLLIIDEESCGLDFAIRAADHDHEVKHWLPPLRDGKQSPIGSGIVNRITDWQKYAKWADLILLTGNSMYRDAIVPLFEKGFPVLGACEKGAELETNRQTGQEILEKYGIETAPYEVFKNFDEAIKFVQKEPKGYAVKPWGGTADKALTFVADRPDDLIFRLQRWKDEGKLKGEFILQQLVKGIEIGVAGWFGPGGWSKFKEENWEEKKLMNGGLGCNTGEQGTTLRFVKKSKLFDRVLRPIEQYLDEVDYVGNVDVNCIIDEKGIPWPLEFTCRLGWPAFNIQQALNLGDSCEWMLDLLHGRDTMEMSSEIAVGVVMTHGDYPYGKQTLEQVVGFPIRGVTNSNRDSLHFQQVQIGLSPTSAAGTIAEAEGYVTAGDYVMVVTGTGGTVNEAQKAAYKTTKQIKWPNSPMFRTDISHRLKKELPLLQSHGYALGAQW